MTWGQRLLAALLALAMIDGRDVRGAGGVSLARGAVTRARGFQVLQSGRHTAMAQTERRWGTGNGTRSSSQSGRNQGTLPNLSMEVNYSRPGYGPESSPRKGIESDPRPQLMPRPMRHVMSRQASGWCDYRRPGKYRGIAIRPSVSESSRSPAHGAGVLTSDAQNVSPSNLHGLYLKLKSVGVESRRRTHLTMYQTDPG
jgi:hypothetical protein